MTFNLLRSRRLILKLFIRSMLSRRLFVGTDPVIRLNDNVPPSKDRPPRKSFLLECATNMNQFWSEFWRVCTTNRSKCLRRSIPYT